MAHESSITLNDYLRQLPPAFLRQTEGQSDLSRFSRVNRFDKILSSCRQASPGGVAPVAKGLTIPDYMAHPVRALLFPTDLAARISGQRYLDAPPQPVPVTSVSLPARPEPSNAGVGDAPVADCRSGRIEPLRVAEPVKELSERQTIDRSIQTAASRYHLPASLIKGVIKAESGFKADAVSSAGARGLMQLMPETARELGVTDSFDIEENIDGGARYLRKMFDLFGGDVKQALMAYNAGPGTVRRYQGDVPYKETRQYVERVLRYSEHETNV